MLGLGGAYETSETQHKARSRSIIYTNVARKLAEVSALRHLLLCHPLPADLLLFRLHPLSDHHDAVGKLCLGRIFI